MTKREQERCDAALSYLKDSKLDLPQVVKASSYFIAGAKWSDKTMIDKAVKWLRENAKDYIVTCYDRGELDDEGLLYNFCKAMEE